MKRFLAMIIAGIFCTAAFSGCGNAPSEEIEEVAEASLEESLETVDDISKEEAEPDKLIIGFVPSHNPEEIIEVTEPLKDLLITELANFGYEIGEVEITVGNTYEAVAEGLSVGTIDVGFIPAGTYVLFDDGCEVILTATREGLSIDSVNAKTWNDKKPTEHVDDKVTFYRALMIAGPSDAGSAIAKKVNSGGEITWEELDELKWSVMDPSSPAGYIYPSLWFQNNYQKHITDLTHFVQSESYEDAFMRLASGQIDVLCCYADARCDIEDMWTTTFLRDKSIWDETNVIGVTDGIYNDTVSVSKSSEIMDDDFKSALSKAMINIAETEAGKEILAIYNHSGYVEAKPEDYDSERAAQELIRSMR